MQNRAGAWILHLVVAVLVLVAPPTSRAGSRDLEMGNPSGATADASKSENFLMDKPYFALSFNNRTGSPNWASWRLVAADSGSSPRFDFHPDDSLPPNYKHVSAHDYSGSGFTRGHLCPHSDRSGNDDSSRATFVMSNMIPQSAECNNKAWDELEKYCRDLARAGDVLYIVDGPAGVGGVGQDGPRTVIGSETQVVVPAKCWKVIMVLGRNQGDTPGSVTPQTRLIAVIMPNDRSVGDAWAGYRVSVAEVEKMTGYTFFDKVDPAVIKPLKARVDSVAISNAH